MADAIIARNLTKRFGNTLALRSVSFAVPSGSVYCIAGPNGSGKTTLLNVLSGSLLADSGSASIHRSIGFCHQNPLLYADLTVHQNLVLFSDMLYASKKDMETLISLLGVADFLGKKVLELSSGTKKKVELAISLLSDPEIILFDEPTTGLDNKSVEDLLSFIRNLRGRKTLVIATHQLSDLEGIATHLLVLKNGEMLFEGKASGSLQRTYKKIIK